MGAGVTVLTGPVKRSWAPMVTEGHGADAHYAGGVGVGGG